MSTIINTTPHEIVLIANETTQVFKRSEYSLRIFSCAQKEIKDVLDPSIPVVTKQSFDGFTWENNNLPPAGSNLLVSMPVGEFFAQYPALCNYWMFGPDTGPDGVIRDTAGKIIGTKRFVLYAKPNNLIVPAHT